MGIAERIDQLGDDFVRRFQDRLDWVEEVVPHPAGWVKLTEREQVTQYLATRSNPQAMRTILNREGLPAVQEWISKMEKARQKYSELQ